MDCIENVTKVFLLYFKSLFKWPLSSFLFVRFNKLESDAENMWGNVGKCGLVHKTSPGRDQVTGLFLINHLKTPKSSLYNPKHSSRFPLCSLTKTASFSVLSSFIYTYSFSCCFYPKRLTIAIMSEIARLWRK